MSQEYAVRMAAEATLRRYGFAKEALDADSLGRAATWLFRNHPSPGYGPGALNTAKDLLHSGANLGRAFLVGSPVNAWKAFQQNARTGGSYLKAYGDLLKNYYWAPHHPNATGFDRVLGNASRAVGLGVTGLDLYQAITGDPAQRRGDLAAAATGALIGPITGSMGFQLGPLAHVAVTNLARSAGHRFDPPANPPRELTQQPPSIGPHIRRAIRAHNMLAGGDAAGLGEVLQDD